MRSRHPAAFNNDRDIAGRVVRIHCQHRLRRHFRRRIQRQLDLVLWIRGLELNDGGVECVGFSLVEAIAPPNGEFFLGLCTCAMATLATIMAPKYMAAVTSWFGFIAGASMALVRSGKAWQS